MAEYFLLFFLSEDFSEADVSRLRQLISELASDYGWADEPPEFIDDTSKDGFEVTRTVGGLLHLPRAEAVVGPQIERAHFDCVERIVNALCAFSARTGCEFELELGGEYVGDIAQGKPNESLAVGLLDEWRKAL